ncbi:MAG: FG-GAP-like repeat-containing protein [Verrucomicrobia bacterium]|nr:FG-GAP-like repeat-containing protein [Verrucomicrobiota bacterium]
MATSIVTANSGTNTVSVLMNLGFGANFRSATNFIVGTGANPRPTDLAVADINGDGRTDLLVANYDENSVSVLTNKGNGVFGGLKNYSVGGGPVSVIVADLNLDGRLDIVTANKTDDTLSVLLGQGNGGFVPQLPVMLSGEPQPVCVRGIDLNGDGVIDLVAANYFSNTISVFIGKVFEAEWQVSRQYDYDVGIHPVSLLVRDLNHDGVLDIAVANIGSTNIQTYFGIGDGIFQYRGSMGVGNAPSAISGSNFNSDDATDIAVANYDDNTVSVLLYAGPLAYDITRSVVEDVPTPIVLRGALLGGGAYSFVTNTLPSHGFVTGSMTNLIYTPNANYFGPDSFSYLTVDVGSLTTSAVSVVTLMVLPVNDVPSFDLAHAQVTIMEDSLTTNIQAFVTNITTGPMGAGETNQTFSFLVTTASNSFFASRPTINPGGTLTFRPAPNKIGTLTASVQMRDSGGTLRGGANLSSVKTFDITVIPHPIKPLRGIYSGLFYEASGVREQAAGFFTFTTTANGSFSGRLMSESGKDAFAGKFDLAGHARVLITRANNSYVELDMQLDMTGVSDQVIGAVSDGNWTADALGDRLMFNSLNHAVQAGRYTLLLPGSTNLIGDPGGDGFATLTVGNVGNISVSGRLADNKTFAQATSLSKNGQWPFYQSLYGGQGLTLGWLNFINRSNSSLEGSVHWISTVSGGKYFPEGFSILSQAIGSTYMSPTNGQRVLALSNNCSLIVSGGNLAGQLTNNVYFSETNAAIADGDILLKLASSANGTLSGSFFHPILKGKRGFYGTVLQQQNTARGFFLGTNQSGAFLLRSN